MAPWKCALRRAAHSVALRPRPEKAREGCPAEGVQSNIRNRYSAKTALLSVS